MNFMGVIFTVILILALAHAYDVSHNYINGRASTKEAEESLEDHNRLRAIHGCPALKLSESLSEGCASYAIELAKINTLKHSDGDYGENLCVRSDSPNKCTQDWYDEIKDYDFSNPGFSSKTGHFTALVWKSSEEMGYGQAVNGSLTFVVVRYTPAGNVMGKFEENVPSKTGAIMIDVRIGAMALIFFLTHIF
ncbi:Golgi-associated plant pathogenesis-related protein 1 [Drosophila bipectinata]|uniref:Golgi-associated plant pathogenesis-related protein 1 n=1 Tax=Drosophila bipectinata TaxID=42026 RepID=UPI0038B2B5B5